MGWDRSRTAGNSARCLWQEVHSSYGLLFLAIYVCKERRSSQKSLVNQLLLGDDAWFMRGS